MAWKIKVKGKKINNKNCLYLNKDGDCLYEQGLSTLFPWDKCEKRRCPLKIFSLFRK